MFNILRKLFVLKKNSSEEKTPFNMQLLVQIVYLWLLVFRYLLQQKITIEETLVWTARIYVSTYYYLNTSPTTPPPALRLVCPRASVQYTMNWYIEYCFNNQIIIILLSIYVNNNSSKNKCILKINGDDEWERKY